MYFRFYFICLSTEATTTTTHCVIILLFATKRNVKVWCKRRVFEWKKIQLKTVLLLYFFSRISFHCMFQFSFPFFFLLYIHEHNIRIVRISVLRVSFKCPRHSWVLYTWIWGVILIQPNYPQILTIYCFFLFVHFLVLTFQCYTFLYFNCWLYFFVSFFGLTLMFIPTVFL